MQHNPNHSEEERFLRASFLGLLSGVGSLESAATWLLTGTSAMVGLMITQVESITKVINLTAFKVGLVCLALSIVAGVIARMMAWTIETRQKAMDHLISYLNSLEAKEHMRAMHAKEITRSQLSEKMTRPLLWPMSWTARRSLTRPHDPLGSEKSSVRSYCWMTLLVLIQWTFVGLGLVALLFGL
jgi:hypothetical protein